MYADDELVFARQRTAERQAEPELRRPQGLFQVGALRAAPVVQHAAQAAVQQPDPGGNGQRFGSQQRAAVGERGQRVVAAAARRDGGTTTSVVRLVGGLLVVDDGGGGHTQIPFVFQPARPRAGQAVAVHDPVAQVQGAGPEAVVHVLASARRQGVVLQDHASNVGEEKRVHHRLRRRGYAEDQLQRRLVVK